MNKYYCPKCNKYVEVDHELKKSEYDKKKGILYLNVEILKCIKCKTPVDLLQDE